MSTFELRLESPDSPQYRIMRIPAGNEPEARALADETERGLAAFTLMPPAREVWEDPFLHRSDDGRVDLSLWDRRDPLFRAETVKHTSYDEAVSAAKYRIADWQSRALIRDGKIVGSNLGGISRGRLLAHQQTEPWAVAEVREVTRAEQEAALAGAEGHAALVRMLKQLRGENDPKLNPDAWPRVIDALRELGIPLAAVTAAVHGSGILTQDDGSAPTVWASNTISIPLLTGLTNNVDTQDRWNDIVASEIANGGGYTTNGPTLGSPTSTYDTATDQTRLDGADVALTSSTLSATDAAVVNRTPGTDATRPVLGSIDFGATVTTTSGTLTVAFDATGIINRDYT